MLAGHPTYLIPCVSTHSPVIGPSTPFSQTSRPELDAYERDFIAFLRSQDPEYGYNICRGGEGFTGPHTKEAKEKISCASRKRDSRPPLYVGPRTDEWKKTMSLIMKKKGHKPFPNKGARNG